MYLQRPVYKPGRIVLAALSLLLLPLVAMQFTAEVVWTPGDFVAAGALLLVPALPFELVLQRTRTWPTGRRRGWALRRCC